MHTAHSAAEAGFVDSVDIMERGIGVTVAGGIFFYFFKSRFMFILPRFSSQWTVTHQ